MYVVNFSAFSRVRRRKVQMGLLPSMTELPSSNNQWLVYVPLQIPAHSPLP